MLVPITKRMIRFAYERVEATHSRCSNCIIAVAVNAVLKPEYISRMIGGLHIYRRDTGKFEQCGEEVCRVPRTPEMQDVITVFDSGNFDTETVLDIPIPAKYVATATEVPNG